MKRAKTGRFTLLLVAFSAVALQAQIIEIVLVDGKSGSPITDASLLNVWAGRTRSSPMVIPTDKHGVARLRFTHNGSEANIPDCKGMQSDFANMQKHPGKQAEAEFNRKYRACTDFEVNAPVVMFADSISINTTPGNVSWKVGGRDHHVGYVPCWVDAKKNKYPWLATTDFSTKEVVEKGVLTTNDCGASTISAHPGQLVLFVRMPTTRESLRQAAE